MADQKVLGYIRENLAKGAKPDDIRLSLLESGWPQAEIEAGMAEAGIGGAPPAGKSPPAPRPSKEEKPEKKGHKKLIVLLFVAIILFILLLYVAAAIVQGFNNMFPEGTSSINSLLGGGG